MSLFFHLKKTPSKIEIDILYIMFILIYIQRQDIYLIHILIMYGMDVS